ncbi:DUF2061 domain-containing protein [Cecembia lonarensis]|uniref:DUF2061 domain-containing protein n=1 Tax=Cecembia lonarensis (strain CCUG 58316 / KCTC 22772 / LW9) TaxID=1225176 RepID=K1LCS5_CECL9|nr:DUF2061 domain-containing protein [Cecembia lonarensis]EKB50012.1 hypothetical protein B879_01294 [Cecembia lonarensis LW9]
MILDQAIKKWFITKKGRDSNAKSLAKSISWRVVGTLDTMVISFFVTGQLLMAVSIGSIEVVTKIALYYLHERAWETATKPKKNELEEEFA